MSGADARRIREALVDPAHTARLLGIETQARAGRRSIDVRCPFHDDASPSLSIFVGGRDGGLGFCCKAAGCGERGDVLSLIARRNGLDTQRDFRKVLEVGLSLIGGAPMPPVKRREVKPVVAPSESALRRVLAKCAPAAKDVAVAGWLRSRGLDGLGVEYVAFALPTGVAGLPRFASPWPHTGHRLVLEAYDAHGRLVTLRARSIVGTHPKSRAPRGGPTTGVVLANAGGLAILRGDPGAPEDVLICEGEPDTLTATLHGIAAIGVMSGDSWTPEIGRKLWGRRITLALHDDAAGDAYAAAVMRSVSGRSMVGDLFAQGRATRALGVGSKGLFDLNDLHIDGVDIATAQRDADIVGDPEDAAFLAPDHPERLSALIVGLCLAGPLELALGKIDVTTQLEEHHEVADDDAGAAMGRALAADGRRGYGEHVHSGYAGWAMASGRRPASRGPLSFYIATSVAVVNTLVTTCASPVSALHLGTWPLTSGARRTRTS